MSMSNLYTPDDPKHLPNWFDVYERDHLLAYRELCKTGAWPSWFWATMKEEEIVITDNWQLMLASKLAEAWLTYSLDG